MRIGIFTPADTNKTIKITVIFSALSTLLPSGIKDFLEDYVVEVGGGKKFIGTAAKVLHNFFEWAREKGYIEEKAFEANSEVLAKYQKRH